MPRSRRITFLASAAALLPAVLAAAGCGSSGSGPPKTASGQSATIEVFAPVPTVGLPVARSGGQLMAQAPVQALIAPESLLNR